MITIIMGAFIAWCVFCALSGLCACLINGRMKTPKPPSEGDAEQGVML